MKLEWYEPTIHYIDTSATLGKIGVPGELFTSTTRGAPTIP